MNVKSCGAVINLRKWSESVGAKGVLNVAWVNVSNIPLDKRHEKNIAYVGSLVGVTLEIDKATINRPESVRIKLGCRDAEDITASAEGVLGGHFYDFFYSVDKILIKTLQGEELECSGKMRKIVPSSISIPSKKFLSYLDACMGEPVVTEIDPTDISDDQKKQSYLVQSPNNSDEKVEVIPTPLLSNLEIISAAVKMGVNIPDDDFDSIDIIRELEISRANIAKKVDKNDIRHDTVLLITNAAGEASLLDTEWGGDADLDIDDFTVKLEMADNVKKGFQLLKKSAAQMLRLCEPPRAEANEQAEDEEIWDEW
ncbi:hypothetical protein D1007_04932 [Hordeum vulgare]|nr:hypothetical protein D1007_04932 [Hordeum vulgare]